MKRIVSIAWALLVLAALLLWLRADVALEEVPEILHAWLGEFGVGRAAAIYVLLYVLRPLVLFPASILTIASGLVFGPWLGIVFTAIGENASANVAFALARWLGSDWLADRAAGSLVARWEQRISENALVAVLVMRLVYLPFDAVNYGCGLTSMRHRDYFVGTFVGIVPGLVSFVLFGGSAAAGVDDRMLVFGLAIFFFVLGLVIARWLRRREPRARADGAGERS